MNAVVSFDRDWSWVKFSDKPSKSIREELKTKGLRYSGRRKAWYLKNGVISQVTVDKIINNNPGNVTQTAIESLETIVSDLESQLEQAMVLLDELRETA